MEKEAIRYATTRRTLGGTRDMYRGEDGLIIFNLSLNGHCTREDMYMIHKGGFRGINLIFGRDKHFLL